MTINDKIRDEKLQYDNNREAAKILALSSEKTDKQAYLTGEGLLPSDQIRMIEKAHFTYFSFRKSSRKIIKSN